MKRKSCPLMLVALCVVYVQQVWGLPLSVFVYNKHNDGFDNIAEGFIWQSLGLVDANGKPGTIQRDGTIKDDRGNVLGQVLLDVTERHIIGYRSADGTREAYNVSARNITTDEAWLRVANNGTFRIIKHGGRFVRGGVLPGGGMMLDNGLMYDGFTNRNNQDQGTRGGSINPFTGRPNGAYPLTPRPGANVTFIADGCNTAFDPDGPGRPMTSVTASAANVPGVGAVQGHVPLVYGNINIDRSYAVD